MISETGTHTGAVPTIHSNEKKRQVPYFKRQYTEQPGKEYPEYEPSRNTPAIGPLHEFVKIENIKTDGLLSDLFTQSFEKCLV